MTPNQSSADPQRLLQCCASCARYEQGFSLTYSKCDFIEDGCCSKKRLAIPRCFSSSCLRDSFLESHRCRESGRFFGVGRAADYPGLHHRVLQFLMGQGNEARLLRRIYRNESGSRKYRVATSWQNRPWKLRQGFFCSRSIPEGEPYPEHGPSETYD